MHLKKDGRYEELFVNEEEGEDDEVLSIFHTPLVVGGVEFSGLPCLTLGENLDLTSDDMVELCAKS